MHSNKESLDMHIYELRENIEDGSGSLLCLCMFGKVGKMR